MFLGDVVPDAKTKNSNAKLHSLNHGTLNRIYYGIGGYHRKSSKCRTLQLPVS